MKILWLCNIAIPQIANYLKISVPPYGGWLTSLADDISYNRKNILGVVFPANEEQEGCVDSIRFWSFISQKNNELRFKSLLKLFKPDIIHIWGTEEKHSVEMMNVCIKTGIVDRVAVSIQGMVSIYARHYYAALPHSIIKSWTFHDMLTKRNIFLGKKNFEKRGIQEEFIIRNARHVIGRTDWDEACVKRLNPKVDYCFCNETLRETFYHGEWSINKCKRHSIFVSQCTYSIKGFHLMLEAFKEILQKYPDAHLYTTGDDPLKLSFSQKIRRTAYSRYIGKLIKQYGLEHNVSFLGILNAEKIKEQYLKSHIFISCSSIENSPNSVGEAMILGVPTISSDVGGVKNLLTHSKDGFIYPWDEPYMIPYYVDCIFSNDNLANNFSESAKRHANQIHNRSDNYDTLIEIYKKIVCTSSKS